jgi:hypothetical protein
MQGFFSLKRLIKDSSNDQRVAKLPENLHKAECMVLASSFLTEVAKDNKLS